MRTLVLVLSFLAVIGSAFWAYSENYRTQAELKSMQELRNEIGSLRESLGMLRAEWAYLNRPDRLRELADINFPRLGLMPLDPGQFGTVEAIAYPAAGLPLPPVSDATDIAATQGQTP